MKQKLPIILDQPGFYRVRVAQSLFVRPSFCPFSFVHCIVFPFSNYEFRINWYLKTCLVVKHIHNRLTEPSVCGTDIFNNPL
jgi:hypothetical protein